MTGAVWLLPEIAKPAWILPRPMTNVKKHNLGILALKFLSVYGVPKTDLLLAVIFKPSMSLEISSVDYGAYTTPLFSIGVTLPIFYVLILLFKDDFKNYLKLSKNKLNN